MASLLLSSADRLGRPSSPELLKVSHGEVPLPFGKVEGECCEYLSRAASQRAVSPAAEAVLRSHSLLFSRSPSLSYSSMMGSGIRCFWFWWLFMTAGRVARAWPLLAPHPTATPATTRTESPVARDRGEYFLLRLALRPACFARDASIHTYAPAWYAHRLSTGADPLPGHHPSGFPSGRRPPEQTAGRRTLLLTRAHCATEPTAPQASGSP